MTTTDVLQAAPPTSGPATRPCLLPGVPVVPLRDGSIQVGCDPDRAVRLTDPPEGTLRLLAELTGDRTNEELAQRCAMAVGPVDEVVEALRRHRLLACESAQIAPLIATPVARVVADAPWGLELALALLAQGVQRVQVVDARRSALVRQAARHRLADTPQVLDRLEVVDDRDRRPLASGTPTILASGRLEPDPAVVEDLVRHDDPHVVARPRPGGALLGPFVVPGRTSCLACADLIRAGRDASWVEQRAVLTSTRADVPAPLVPWLTSMLLAQLASWALGGPPDLVDRTVEMSLHDWRQRWRAWRPHPRCGCR